MYNEELFRVFEYGAMSVQLVFAHPCRVQAAADWPGRCLIDDFVPTCGSGQPGGASLAKERRIIDEYRMV